MVTGRLAVTLVGAPGPYVTLIKTKYRSISTCKSVLTNRSGPLIYFDEWFYSA